MFCGGRATRRATTSRAWRGINGKFLGATRADLAHVGDLFAVPSYESVIDEVLAAVGRWPELAEQAGLDRGSPKVQSVTADITNMRPT